MHSVCSVFRLIYTTQTLRVSVVCQARRGINLLKKQIYFVQDLIEHILFSLVLFGAKIVWAIVLGFFCAQFSIRFYKVEVFKLSLPRSVPRPGTSLVKRKVLYEVYDPQWQDG